MLTTYLLCVGSFFLGWIVCMAFTRDAAHDTTEQAYRNLRNGTMRPMDEQELRDAADFDRDFREQTRVG